MSNWGTLNHHHHPFYSIETFIRAAKNASKTQLSCSLIFHNPHHEMKNKRSFNKVREGYCMVKKVIFEEVNFLAAVE